MYCNWAEKRHSEKDLISDNSVYIVLWLSCMVYSGTGYQMENIRMDLLRTTQKCQRTADKQRHVHIDLDYHNVRARLLCSDSGFGATNEEELTDLYIRALSREPVRNP